MTQERKIELKVAGNDDLELEAIKIKVASATQVDVEILRDEYDMIAEEVVRTGEEIKTISSIMDANTESIEAINKELPYLATKEELANVKVDTSDLVNKEDFAALSDAFNAVDHSLYATKKDLENIKVDVDTSNLVTKEELGKYAKKEDIPAPPDLSSKQDRLTESQLANLNKDHSKYLTEHQSLEGYAKLTDIPEPEDLSGYALKTEIPKKMSELEADCGFLTEHQDISHLASKSELPTALSELTNDVGYITDVSDKQDVISDLDEIREGARLGKTAIQEHQDLSAYALKTEIPDISIKQDKLSEAQLANLNADHSKYLTEHQDISGLALKSEIPSLEGYAKLEDIPAPPDLSSYALRTELPDITVKQDKLTPEQLANINADHSKYLTEHQDLSAYALKTEIPEQVDLSGYALKSEIPEVPENISSFNNDAGYLTEHQDISGKQDVILDLAEIRAGAALGKTAIQEHQDLSAYALKTELPDISVKQDKLSEAQLANINADHSKYLTEHQDLTGYAKLEDIPAAPDLSSYALKSEIPTIPDHSVYALKTEIPDISTKADSSNVYTKTEIDTMLGNMDSVLTALGV